MNRILLLLTLALGLCVGASAQIVGQASGQAGKTGAIPGSVISVQNNGASSFILITNTTGSPASFSIEIDGSTDNGHTFPTTCGSANTTNTISSTTCTGAQGTYDHIDVNVTALSANCTVFWSLLAVYPINVTATISGQSHVIVDSGTLTGITNNVKVVGPTNNGSSPTAAPVEVSGVGAGDGLIHYLKTDNAGDPIIGYATGNARNNVSFTPVVSGSAESSHVLSTTAGATLYKMYVTTGATTGFLMLFNATSAPGDGAVTPQDCIAAPANSTTAVDEGLFPITFTTGITAVFSSTGCFTKTASATAFFSAQGVF